jgi:hypothetical protein
MGPIS